MPSSIKIKLLLTLCLLAIRFEHIEAKSAKIENVKLAVKNEKIIVTYDISDFDIYSSYDIGLKILSAQQYVPISVTGDVGKGVLGGQNKMIIWDVYQDVDKLVGKIKARVSVINESRPFGGRASNVWKSVVYPGWGQHYVGKGNHKLLSNKRGVVTSLLFTAAIAGTVTFYLDYEFNWKQKYLNYDNPLSLTSQRYQDEIRGYREKANRSLQTADIFLVVATAIWVCDVISVYNKGKKNIRTNPYLRERKKTMPMLSFRSFNNSFYLMLGLSKTI